MTHQEGPEGQSLLQLPQSQGQAFLTTQTARAELQPVVHLQSPGTDHTVRKNCFPLAMHIYGIFGIYGMIFINNFLLLMANNNR